MAHKLPHVLRALRALRELRELRALLGRAPTPVPDAPGAGTGMARWRP